MAELQNIWVRQAQGVLARTWQRYPWTLGIQAKKVKAKLDGKDVEVEVEDDGKEPKSLEDFQAALTKIADKEGTLSPEEVEQFT